MKHFKLTSKTKVNFLGKTLFQIEATINSKWAKKGDKGGWVEKGENLSGNAWVSGNAEVFGNAKCTKLAMTLNFKHLLTLTDNHIIYGCEYKTIKEWEEWLKTDEEFKTSRDSKEFKIIEMALNLAIEYSKIRK